ncbi:hypothetical protein TNCV_4955631 [Trichonephila clavipes]|nr:hypothetical protein TNCV_4955631 [Trichonephila clavipes]
MDNRSKVIKRVRENRKRICRKKGWGEEFSVKPWYDSADASDKKIRQLNLVCSCDGLSWNLKIILNILITDYNIRLWESKLCNYSELEMECDNFKKICQELFQIKFKQITENSFDEIKNVCDYSNFQEQVIQLFVSTKSILMKFM